VVLRRYPFTIILKARTEGDLQPIQLKADPGSKVTGVSLVADYAKRGKTVVWAMDLQHRGQSIKDALDSNVVSEEAGVIARPDTVLHGSITAPDRMVG